MCVARWVVGVLAIALAGGPVAAAELTLEFRDGRVTLMARDVSVRQILEEWSKVGQTRIVNGDQASATPVTLQLDAMPERQALDVVLRSAAGYLAAPRRESNPGPSAYDRILVLAVSNPPAGSSAGAAPEAFPAPRRGAPLLQPPAPLLLPSDEPEPSLDDLDNDAGPAGLNPPGFRPGDVPGRAPAGVAPYPRVPGAVPFNPATGVNVPGVVVPIPEQSPARTAQPPIQ